MQFYVELARKDLGGKVVAEVVLLQPDSSINIEALPLRACA